MPAVASDVPPFCRKTVLHELRGAAHALFLLEALALARGAGNDEETWAWTYERIFSEDGAGLVVKSFSRLGHTFAPLTPEAPAREKVQAFLISVRRKLDEIRKDGD